MFGYSVLGFGGSNLLTTFVKSVQTGSITIGSGATSNTAMINSVDTAKSVCFLNGWRTGTSAQDWHSQESIIELTNATTVTAKRGTSDTATSTVYYTVVEFTSLAVLSVQQGEISVTGTNASNTATITSVGTGNSVCINRGSNTTSDDNQSTVFGEIELTDSTTVTASRPNTTLAHSFTVAYTVIEFQSGIIQSVQNIDDTSSTTAATETTETISAVTMANTAVFWRGGQNTAATFLGANTIFYCQLTSTTNVSFFKGGTNNAARSLRATVCEFTSGVVKTMNRGTIALNSGSASNTATVSAVNTNKSLLNFQYFSTDGTTVNQDDAASVCVLTNSTTITASRSATTNNVVVAYELIEFY